MLKKDIALQFRRACLTACFVFGAIQLLQEFVLATIPNAHLYNPESKYFMSLLYGVLAFFGGFAIDFISKEKSD